MVRVASRSDRPPAKYADGGLAQRLADHRGGLGAVMLEQLTQRDLDREDGDLGGLDAVVLRVVEDQLEHRIAQLVLDQRVDLLDPLGEHLVAQVQALAHLAVLRAESGQHPHRAVGHRPVDAEHVRALLALGDRAQALDGLVVVVGQHHRARAAVVAPRQRPADRLQRRRLALRAFHPVRQLGGGGLLARGQERRHGQRDQRLGRLRGLLRRKLFQRDLLEPQRLVGDAGQFGLSPPRPRYASAMMLPKSSNRSEWPSIVRTSAGVRRPLRRRPSAPARAPARARSTSRGKTSRTTRCALAPPKPKLDTPASA